MTRRTGFILLISIAILGGIMYYLSLSPQIVGIPTPTSAAVAPNLLWTIDTAQIKSLLVSDSAKGLTFAAAVDDAGVWQMSQPQKAQLDSTVMSNMTSNLAAISINRTLTEEVNLASFGLTAPTYAIEVKLKDGKTLRATVGDKDVTGFTYYVLPEGSTKPVLVPTSSLDALLALPSQPPLVTPTAPVTLEPLPALPGPGTPSP